MECPKIAIIEDEFIVAEDIRHTLQTHGYQVVGSFDSGEQALQQLAHLEPDLLLIDIRLSGAMSGIQLAEEFGKQRTLPIIYVTANSDDNTFERAKATRPIAFLVKPFNTPTLLATVDLAFYRQGNSNSQNPSEALSDGANSIINNSIFIRTHGKFKKIPLNDLLFIEADGSYLTLVTPTQKFKLTHNLSDFQRRISTNALFRVHRSFIINLEKIDTFDDGYACIGEYNIPISKSYRSEFLTKLKLI